MTFAGLVCLGFLGALIWSRYRAAQAADETAKKSAEEMSVLAMGGLLFVLGLTAIFALNSH